MPKTSRGGGKTLNYLLAGVFAFAASGAWAEDDWTVSENTKLTEDMTVGALTVNSGVTLDLNGYKLTCTSLDGSGTITSTGVDLTTSGGTCWASQSAAQASHGNVANLFKNNFDYKWDGGHRFLLATSKLPVNIDYDFGADNAKVVNKYKIWGGNSERSPKEWVLYGSNTDAAYGAASDDSWTEVDPRSNETGWTHGNVEGPAEGRLFECNNTTAYRYYRLKIKGTVKPSNGYLEMVQLEYFKSGELHLNVASGSATWPASITFSGNIKVVKEGSGTLESSGVLDMNDGTFVIAAGTVRSSGNFRLANVSGKTVNVEVAEGGTLYSGGILAIGCGGTATLTVNGGTVYSSGDMFTGNNASGSGTLNLNGGMLKTKCIKAAKKGYYGYLNFDGGTLQANAKSDDYFFEDLTGVNVKSGGGTIDANGYSVKIGKSITGEGAMRFKGGSTITFSYNCNHEGGTTIELGTKVSMTAVSTTTILDNLVIDGRAVLEAKTYDVFLKSGLTEESIKNITLTNCAAGSTIGFDNDETPTKITVTLAAPTGVNITTPIMAFEGKTLNELKYADFTSRMFGIYANSYNALDSAKGCNKKFYYDDGGNLSRIVVEFQVSDGANIRCVVVEFKNGDGGVYAQALGARYQENASLGFLFLEQNKTTWHGADKVVATSRAKEDYGACDFRYTMGETPDAEWMLDTDKTWSALRNDATLDSDDIVRITVTDADAVLMVDENVEVRQIVFVSGSSATLKIAESMMLTAEDVSGIRFVHNDGVIEKTGEGESTIPLNRDYSSDTGIVIVGNGTLKAIKTGTGDCLNKVRVASGAVFDVNGNSVSLDVTLEEGAHLVNNGANIRSDYQQINTLTLEGNATVTANGNFGFVAPGLKSTYLNLDSHTLTVNVAKNKEFMLCNTTIIDDGTIYVASGRFCTRSKDSTGEDCTISIGESGIFENNKIFKVKNFVNNGTISYASSWGRGMLEITGLFESKTASIPKLTLTGATLKARAGVVVTVLDSFEASGTIIIDASDITKADFDRYAEQLLPVLTVPTTDKYDNWIVSNSPIDAIRAKWIDNGNDTSTLYLCKSKGTRIIIR